MKLIALVLLCCLAQGINSNPIIGGLVSNVGKLASTAVSSVTNLATSLANSLATIVSSVSSINLVQFTSSLQCVISNVDQLLGSVSGVLAAPLDIVSNLLISVDDAFASITSSTQSLGAELTGVVGVVDVAIGGVSASLSSVIQIVLDATNATVLELSSAVDNAIDAVVRTIEGLVELVNEVLCSSLSVAIEALEAVLRAVIIVVYKALTVISASLKDIFHVGTLTLSSIVSALSTRVIDCDVNAPIDVDALVEDLLRYNSGAIIEVTVVSSTLDGNSEDVYVAFTAVSCLVDEPWEEPINDLSSSAVCSLDKNSYLIENLSKSLPNLNDVIIPQIDSLKTGVQTLINEIISSGNDILDSTLDDSVLSIGETLQNLFDSATLLDNVDCGLNGVVATAVEAVTLTLQSIGSIVYTVLGGVLVLLSKLSVIVTPLLEQLFNVLGSTLTLSDLSSQIGDILSCGSSADNGIIPDRLIG